MASLLFVDVPYSTKELFCGIAKYINDSHYGSSRALLKYESSCIGGRLRAVVRNKSQIEMECPASC